MRNAIWRQIKMVLYSVRFVRIVFD